MIVATAIFIATLYTSERVVIIVAGNEINISVQSIKGLLSDEEVQEMMKAMLSASLRDENKKRKK